MANFSTIIQSEKFRSGLNLGKGLLGGIMTQITAQQQLSGIDEASASIKAASNFNISIDRLNTKRRLESLGRQTSRVTSSLQSAAVGSGIGGTSKTALAFVNEALTNFEREVGQELTSQAHRDTAAKFESDSQVAQLEAQKVGTQVNRLTSLFSDVGNVSNQLTSFLGNK